jgi:hypothetical protein
MVRDNLILGGLGRERKKFLWLAPTNPNFKGKGKKAIKTNVCMQRDGISSQSAYLYRNGRLYDGKKYDKKKIAKGRKVKKKETKANEVGEYPTIWSRQGQCYCAQFPRKRKVRKER